MVKITMNKLYFNFNPLETIYAVVIMLQIIFYFMFPYTYILIIFFGLNTCCSYFLSKRKENIKKEKGLVDENN